MSDNIWLIYINRQNPNLSSNENYCLEVHDVELINWLKWSELSRDRNYHVIEMITWLSEEQETKLSLRFKCLVYLAICIIMLVTSKQLLLIDPLTLLNCVTMSTICYYIMCISYLYYVYHIYIMCISILCVYYVYIMCILCAYYVHIMCILCVYYV